jgi:hypothetical protein
MNNHLLVRDTGRSGAESYVVCNKLPRLTTSDEVPTWSFCIPPSVDSKHEVILAHQRQRGYRKNITMSYRERVLAMIDQKVNGPRDYYCAASIGTPW